jgi:hypothetical protein
MGVFTSYFIRFPLEKDSCYGLLILLNKNNS